MDVVVWPRGLGLEKYEVTFREDEIDETVLPSLADQNLKELSFCPVLSVTTKQASNSSTD
jgi:hypothetical protein